MTSTPSTTRMHTSRAELQFRRVLRARGGKIEMYIHAQGQTHRLDALFSAIDDVRLCDPGTAREYGSPSAHRADVFPFKTSNTYDAYRDMLTGLPMRTVLGLGRGAP